MSADTFVYTGAAFFMAAVLFLALLLWRIIRVIRPSTRKGASRPGITFTLTMLILVILCFSLSGLALSVSVNLRMFRVFNQETPIAEIRIHPLGNETRTQVELVDLSSGDEPTSTRFAINGDQWMLAGSILLWTDWLRMLGLQPRYRLSRIRGRFMNEADERGRQPSVYSLASSSEKAFWQQLYKYSSRMPLVSTAYGAAVFQQNTAGKSFRVFVGLNGFVVREIIR